jgi:hypothetical protein
MTQEQKEALIEERTYLVMLHQIYLDTEELGLSPEERVEHMLDIMTRISEIDRLLEE